MRPQDARSGRAAIASISAAGYCIDATIHESLVIDARDPELLESLRRWGLWGDRYVDGRAGGSGVETIGKPQIGP
jgi:hypothetical protein